MELRQIRYFVTVAGTLSFSEAARRLYITQGTLSQQIRQLEDELGTPLFIRNSHTVELTEEGVALLPLARRTLDAAQACSDSVKDHRKMLCGTLNIGVTYSFTEIVAVAVKNFLKEYPGVNMKVYCKTAEELYDMLKDRQIDMMMAFKPAQEHLDVESSRLFEYSLRAIMRKSHPLAGRSEVTLDDLSRQWMALPAAGLQARAALDKQICIDTTRLNLRVEINDPNLILDLIQSTDMISILSSQTIQYRPGLVAIPIKDIDYRMQGCVHFLKEGYRKRSADVFIDMLKEEATLMNLI